MPIAEEFAFVASVRERPEEDGPRLIFADWLDERDDPRGEFIRVQCALARVPIDDPRRSDLELREHELLEAHGPSWTANLQGLISDSLYRRGFLECVSVDASAFLKHGSDLFRYGPIKRVRFIDASRCFAELMESPLLVNIRELDLVGNSVGNGGMSQLARARYLAHLELLHLGYNDLTDQGLRTLADIPHLSQLRELYLGDNREIGTPGLRALSDSPYLSHLRQLDLSGNGLTETAIKVLINGEALKALDNLAIQGNQIGDGGVEALARSELLKRMLARSPTLNLSQNNIGPIGARALAESPFVEPLEALDFGFNVLGDAGLASLAQSPYLRHLRRLNVEENRIGDGGVMALARSRMAETLETIDLKGNFVTSDSTRVLDEAVSALDWRRKIEIRTDPGLHLRATRPPR